MTIKTVTIRHDVPALDIDKLMLEQYKHAVGPHGILERRVAWNMLCTLEDAGFGSFRLNDGEEWNKCETKKDVMELLFNLDEAWITCRKNGGKRHTIFMVLGNGTDILCDYSYSEDDADGFNATLADFDGCDYA